MLENVNGVFMNRQDFPASDAGSCAILHDIDNDGDLDFTGIDELDDFIYFWLNDPQVTDSGDTPVLRNGLDQNQPNPFNPTTRISYFVASESEVDLSIFDARGNFVTTLVRARESSGVKQVDWEGTTSRGIRVSSGVYFYRLVVGSERLVRKMTLVK
jgi:hypothetical protein